MTVWVMESGEYEDRAVDGIFVSVQAGDEWLKARYGAPYVVRWEPPEESTWNVNGETFTNWEITGHFERVPDYSGSHTRTYTLTRYDVVGA